MLNYRRRDFKIILLQNVPAILALSVFALLNRSANQDTTVQYALVFCAFSWPHMVRWHNSGIISTFISFYQVSIKTLLLSAWVGGGGGGGGADSACSDCKFILIKGHSSNSLWLFLKFIWENFGVSISIIMWLDVSMATKFWQVVLTQIGVFQLNLPQFSWDFHEDFYEVFLPKYLQF